MTDSKTILEQAAGIYLAAGKQYRDAMLQVGRLLHEYVLARLREGDLLNEAERREAGATRSRAVLDAARRLGVRAGRVNELIRTAMAEQLLGEGRGAGDLSYASVRHFGVLVARRRHKEVRRSRAGKAARRPDQPEPSDREVWVAREIKHGDPKALFRKHVEAGSLAKDIARDLCGMKVIYRGTQAQRLGRKRSGFVLEEKQSESQDPVAMARSATPKDLAEWIAALVAESEDPQAVIRELENLVRRGGNSPQAGREARIRDHAGRVALAGGVR